MRERAMITLDVKDYCHNCPGFEAEVISDSTRLYAGGVEYCEASNKVVKCRYRKRCEAMMKYLEKEKSKS